MASPGWIQVLGKGRGRGAGAQCWSESGEDVQDLILCWASCFGTIVIQACVFPPHDSQLLYHQTQLTVSWGQQPLSVSPVSLPPGVCSLAWVPSPSG